MFEIVSARGVPLMSNGKLVDIDYSILKLNLYTTRYSNIYFHLKYEGKDVGLSYNNIPLSAIQSGLTLRTYLDGLTTILPTLDTELKYSKVIKANYFNLWDFNPKLQQSNVNFHIDTILDPDDLPDVDLTLQFDNHLLQENCLITIAGLVHRLYVNTDRAVVMHGSHTLNTSKDASVGLIDFSPLGGITPIDITEDMLYTRNDSRYLTGVYVRCPESLVGKTPMLVLAGKLIRTGLLQVVGDRVIKIDLGRLELISHYHELQARTKLDLPVVRTSGGGILNESLETDDYIKALLTSVMSYIVLIGSEGINFGTEAINSTHLPGVYESVDPNSIVLSETGYLMDYVSIPGGLIKSSLYARSNPIRNTGGTERSEVSIEQSCPSKPVLLSRAHILSITKQSME